MDKDLTELSFCLHDVTTVNLRQQKNARNWKSESNSCDVVTLLLVKQNKIQSKMNMKQKVLRENEGKKVMIIIN